MTHHQIYAECKRYGLIVSCMVPPPDFNVRVILERSKKSDSLKPSHPIRIGNESFVLEWTRDFFPDRPAREYPELVPDQQSPHNMLNALSDDCLRVIFDKLAKRDLCAAYSVAHVNQRFRNVVMDIKPEWITVSDENCDPLWKLEKMVRIFGASIKGADISTRRCPDIIMVFLLKYCPNLKGLKGNFQFKNTIFEMDALFPRLHLLQMYHMGCNADAVFQPNPYISSISIGSVSTLPAIRLPRLRQLRVDIGKVEISQVSRFFALNRQIEKLELFPVPNHFIPTILANLPNLQKLDVYFRHLHTDDITAICQMKRLHTLRVDFNRGDAVAMLLALMESGIQLRVLKFVRTGSLQMEPIEYDIMYLTQMKSLQHLELNDLCDNDLVRLFANCNNLTGICGRSNHLTPRGIHEALKYSTHLESAILEVTLGERSHILIEQCDDIDGIARLRAEKQIDLSLMICIIVEAQQDFEVSCHVKLYVGIAFVLFVLKFDK